jgi:hypothetical protein
MSQVRALVVQQEKREIMIDKDSRFKGKTGILLGEDIYLYENFYRDIDSIESSLAEMSEADWKTHGNYEAEDHSNNIWNDRLSLDFIGRNFHDSIINFVSPQYWILSNGNFIRTRTTDDSVSQDMSTFEDIPYALAYYAGNFSGGEIRFINLGLTYSPKRNDLLIFKPTEIEVLKVKSGVKYSYIDFLVKPPGYFMA